MLKNLAACRQVIGKDFHASAIVGADNLKTDGADFGIEAEWAQREQPKGTAHSAHPLEPTAVAFNSQHVRCNAVALQFASICIC